MKLIKVYKSNVYKSLFHNYVSPIYAVPDCMILSNAVTMTPSK